MLMAAVVITKPTQAKRYGSYEDGNSGAGGTKWPAEEQPTTSNTNTTTGTHVYNIYHYDRRMWPNPGYSSDGGGHSKLQHNNHHQPHDHPQPNLLLPPQYSQSFVDNMNYQYTSRRHENPQALQASSHIQQRPNYKLQHSPHHSQRNAQSAPLTSSLNQQLQYPPYLSHQPQQQHTLQFVPHPHYKFQYNTNHSQTRSQPPSKPSPDNRSPQQPLHHNLQYSKSHHWFLKYPSQFFNGWMMQQQLQQQQRQQHEDERYQKSSAQETSIAPPPITTTSAATSGTSAQSQQDFTTSNSASFVKVKESHILTSTTKDDDALTVHVPGISNVNVAPTTTTTTTTITGTQVRPHPHTTTTTTITGTQVRPHPHITTTTTTITPHHLRENTTSFSLHPTTAVPHINNITVSGRLQPTSATPIALSHSYIPSLTHRFTPLSSLEDAYFTRTAGHHGSRLSQDKSQDYTEPIVTPFTKSDNLPTVTHQGDKENGRVDTVAPIAYISHTNIENEEVVPVSWKAAVIQTNKEHVTATNKATMKDHNGSGLGDIVNLNVGRLDLANPTVINSTVVDTLEIIHTTLSPPGSTVYSIHHGNNTNSNETIESDKTVTSNERQSSFHIRQNPFNYTNTENTTSNSFFKSKGEHNGVERTGVISKAPAITSQPRNGSLITNENPNLTPLSENRYEKDGEERKGARREPPNNARNSEHESSSPQLEGTKLQGHKAFHPGPPQCHNRHPIPHCLITTSVPPSPPPIQGHLPQFSPASRLRFVLRKRPLLRAHKLSQHPSQNVTIRKVLPQFSPASGIKFLLLPPMVHESAGQQKQQQFGSNTSSRVTEESNDEGTEIKSDMANVTKHSTMEDVSGTQEATDSHSNVNDSKVAQDNAFKMKDDSDYMQDHNDKDDKTVTQNNTDSRMKNEANHLSLQTHSAASIAQHRTSLATHGHNITKSTEAPERKPKDKDELALKTSVPEDRNNKYIYLDGNSDSKVTSTDTNSEVTLSKRPKENISFLVEHSALIEESKTNNFFVSSSSSKFGKSNESEMNNREGTKSIISMAQGDGCHVDGCKSNRTSIQKNNSKLELGSKTSLEMIIKSSTPNSEVEDGVNTDPGTKVIMSNPLPEIEIKHISNINQKRKTGPQNTNFQNGETSETKLYGRKTMSTPENREQHPVEKETHRGDDTSNSSANPHTPAHTVTPWPDRARIRVFVTPHRHMQPNPPHQTSAFSSGHLSTQSRHKGKPVTSSSSIGTHDSTGTHTPEYQISHATDTHGPPTHTSSITTPWTHTYTRERGEEQSTADFLRHLPEFLRGSVFIDRADMGGLAGVAVSDSYGSVYYQGN
ncbi:serine-rich adhesin for platelets-like [Eriocheir sinensis]|uniref:serine-rich adhesin for platelets-like n=1 Tax=Eriocheir sinensis TaxID=95602 RepID=UPI0021C9D32D|nr:serine-rich adhesin for platelets-like [Eriocheir sinensis]